jgi:gliding motility-associated-like protein
LKKFIFILLSVICGVANAQQSNHWVVQGYQEIIDTSLIFSNLDTLKKINYFDIDLNSPEIKVHKLSSNRIKYNYYGTPPTASTVKISQGYQTISNSKGHLLAYVFNNVLHNNKGDSIDYLTQYGCKRGVASQISISDTFTLYYIQSKTEYNATSFESQYYNTNEPWQPLYKFHNDSFFLMEVKYFDNKRIGKKRISDFAKWGDINMLESNVVFFIDQFKEFRVQFVWDKFLYDVNVSRNNQTLSTQIIFQNTNEQIKMRWYDFSESGSHTPSELTVSPSGRWTVFNWYYSKFINNSYKYSISKAILITNNNLKVSQIVSDSGDNEKRPFLFWKNAVFTNNDSTFLLYTGQVENIRVKWKVLEVSIQGNNIGKSYFDILVDPSFTTGWIYNTITDFCLAPNGNNYAFFHRYSPRYLSNGQIRWILDFGLAKFVKNQTYYTITNPILVLQGFNSESYEASGQDKIFFPATPTPYHYINFKYKSLCNDLNHEFTNETDTNWFNHFLWFWGDGDSTKSVKSQTKIRHKYSKPGKYKVLLKSITADGGWVWYSDSIEVLPEPIAKYYTKNTVGCQWIAVEFSDSSILQKKSHTWKWDFGDGTDTSLTSPGNIMPKNKSIKHTYTTSGKFNVQLQVSDGRCIDTFNAIQNISILPAPRPGIAIDKTTGCSPLNIAFGRLHTDPTDSTVYHFKPSLVPNNRFDQAINKVLIQQSGRFTLFQKLYGPSGCITQDSVKLAITPGIAPGYKPQLKRSTVINNTTTLTEWKPVPYAKSYQVYRNGQLHAVVNDTFFKDYLSAEIDQSHTYELQAKDSCDNLGGLKSNIGKTIFLKVTEVEPASKSDFPTALLTWSPYEDWTTNGGVKRHESFGTYDIETSNWQPLNNQKDTQFSDKDFVQPKKFQKCYIVKAQSSDIAYESQSNSFCLGYQATLFAPSAFTPNGDGLNDEFEIFNYGFDHFTLTIFNSWGQKIYEQEGSNAIWKPAADMPLGVYVYTIKASRENKEYTFSSTVTLLK